MKKISNFLILALLAIGMGLASCTEQDNPAGDPNPLAAQVSGLWWSLTDQKGTYSDATDSYTYTRIGQAICFNGDGAGYGVTFFFNDEQGEARTWPRSPTPALPTGGSPSTSAMPTMSMLTTSSSGR